MPQVNLTNVLIVDANFGVDIAGNLTVNGSSLTIDHAEWGIYVNGSVAAVTIANTIITNASTDGIIATASGTTSVSYSDIWNCPTSTSKVTTGAGMLSANPQYVASGSDYYRLQPSSVCIDSGTSTGAPDHDLDGAPRPLDGDGIDGAQYDMGAYEYNAGGGIGGAGGSAAGTGGAAGAAGAAGTRGAGGAAGAGGLAGAGAAGSGGSAGVGGAASGGSGGGAAGVGGATGTAGAAGAAGASAGSSGSGGGTAGQAGAGGSGGGLGGGTDGSAGGRGSNGSSGAGCGCQTGGPPGSAWALVLVSAALILRRRRRDGRT